jgi:hypothetical protein
MSDTSVSLPHALTGSRRYCTAGYAIARWLTRRVCLLLEPSKFSRTAFARATTPIRPPHKHYGPITASQLVTDTASPNHKSP